MDPAWAQVKGILKTPVPWVAYPVGFWLWYVFSHGLWLPIALLLHGRVILRDKPIPTGGADLEAYQRAASSWLFTATCLSIAGLLLAAGIIRDAIVMLRTGQKWTIAYGWLNIAAVIAMIVYSLTLGFGPPVCGQGCTPK